MRANQLITGADLLETAPSSDQSPTPPSGVLQVWSPPPTTNRLCALPPELLLGIAAYLDCVSHYRLLQTCRDLHALLNADLKKAPDNYGNNRYLYKLLKTGNLAEIKTWPGTPSSALFTLQNDMLLQYQKTARREVYDRMQKLGGLYPCLRLAKSGLMVALDHEQWATAAFLLRRDGGHVGFLGTKEYFWAARFTSDFDEHERVKRQEATNPDPDKEPGWSYVMSKPPLWEHFTTVHWLGTVLDGGEEVDIARLLWVIDRKLAATG